MKIYFVIYWFSYAIINIVFLEVTYENISYIYCFPYAIINTIFLFFHSSYKNYYSLILDRPKYLYLRMEGVKIKMHPITILIHMSMRDRWLFMCSLGVNHISLCIKTNWRHEYFCLPVASPSFVFPSTHIGVWVSMSCLLPVPPAAVPPAACRGAAAKTLVSTQLLWQLCFYK